MKILITGASGPFGSGVIRGLIAKGVKPSDLILVSRDPTKLTEFTSRGAQARAGDFDDYSSLEKAFAGADRMLMISTNRVGQREPQHRNAVNAAKAAGVRHVIYTSFVGRQGCVSMALADHRFTEQLLTESGLDWTFMRNSQYSEAMRDAGAPAAIRSGQWLSASGEGRIALVTRDDCIAAAVAVVAGQGHENKVYEITGPALLSYRELATLVSELTGHKIEYKEVGADGMYALFDAIGVPRSAQDDRVVNGFGWCSDDMVSFERTIAAGDFAVLSDDFEKLTGRKPQSMRDFLMRHRDQLMSVQPA